MEKMAKRILAGMLGALIVLGLLLTVNMVTGDPVSRWWANRQAIAYAETLYPGQTFAVSGEWGNGMAYCGTAVQSQQSTDTYFNVQTRFLLFTNDRIGGQSASHETAVETGWNTCYRMSREAGEQVGEILRDTLAEFAQVGVTVQLCWEQGNDGTGGQQPQNYRQWMERDAPFDKTILENVPAKLSVGLPLSDYIPDEGEMKPILQRIKAAMVENGYDISYYELSIDEWNADAQTGQYLFAATDDIADAYPALPDV